MTKKFKSILLILCFILSFFFNGLNLNSACGVWTLCSNGTLLWCEVFGTCPWESCGSPFFGPGVACFCGIEAYFIDYC